MKQSKRFITIVLVLMFTSLKISASMESKEGFLGDLLEELGIISGNQPEEHSDCERVYKLDGNISGNPSVSPDGSKIVALIQSDIIVTEPLEVNSKAVHIYDTKTGALLKVLPCKNIISAQWISNEKLMFLVRTCEEGVIRTSIFIWKIK